MSVSSSGYHESVGQTQATSMLGAQGSGQHGNVRVERHDCYREEIEYSLDAVPSITRAVFADGSHKHLGKS